MSIFREREGSSSRRWSAAALLALAMVLGCNNVFYYPSRHQFVDPTSLGLQYTDAFFESLDGKRLHGWFFPASGGLGGRSALETHARARATVVHFHGNAENITTHFWNVAWLPGEGYNVFAFDYRGYGRSAGSLDRTGIQDDAAAAVRYVRTRPDVDPQRLILFGQSLGGAIAVYVAAAQTREGIRAVVIDSAFSGYRAIVREKLGGSWLTWPLQWPLSFLVSDRLSPKPVIHRVSPIPLLIIHGTADEIVPYHHAEELFAAAREPKTLWLVPNAGHTQVLQKYGEVYRRRLIAFFEEALRQGEDGGDRKGGSTSAVSLP